MLPQLNKYLLKNNNNILTFVIPGDIFISNHRNPRRDRGAAAAGHMGLLPQNCDMGGYREALMEEKKEGRSLNYEVELYRKKKMLTLCTKYLLDIMFYMGLVATVSLPYSIRRIGELFPMVVEHYEETVIIYSVLGIAALVLVRELRRIFKTVLAEDCFVRENVVSLQKMGNWSFFIAVMSVVRSIVYMTIAMGVVILVFVIAGLFSKVLACVFEEAVRYKQENDLTI